MEKGTIIIKTINRSSSASLRICLQSYNCQPFFVRSFILSHASPSAPIIPSRAPDARYVPALSRRFRLPPRRTRLVRLPDTFPSTEGRWSCCPPGLYSQAHKRRAGSACTSGYGYKKTLWWGFLSLPLLSHLRSTVLWPRDSEMWGDR